MIVTGEASWDAIKSRKQKEEQWWFARIAVRILMQAEGVRIYSFVLGSAIWNTGVITLSHGKRSLVLFLSASPVEKTFMFQSASPKPSFALKSVCSQHHQKLIAYANGVIKISA